MKNLLAQKGCDATLLHDDTWSLTLPDSSILELCFESEIELCDFLEDLPDIETAASSLHARGYTSLRPTDAVDPDSNQQQRSEAPPVNVYVNLDSRDITGLLKNEVAEPILHKSNGVYNTDSDGGHVIANVVFMILLFGATISVNNGKLPNGDSGWLFLLISAAGSTAACAAIGVIVFFLLSKKTNRITIGIFVSYAAFALSVYGNYYA